MITHRGKLLHHVIVPIALLVGLSMGMVVAFIWFSARAQDEVALAQSVETVRDAIGRQLAKIGLAAKDYTWWDEAVANLELLVDPLDVVLDGLRTDADGLGDLLVAQASTEKLEDLLLARCQRWE